MFASRNQKRTPRGASRKFLQRKAGGSSSSYNLNGESKSVGRGLWSNFGFPDRARVRLAYGQRVAVTVSTITGAQIFRGGSCFDPDYTGGGNQPAQFDLFAAAYFRYKVHGSSIKVQAVTTSGSTAVRIGLLPTNNTTTVIDLPDLLTNSRSQEVIVGAATWRAPALTDSQRSDTILGSKGLTADNHTALVSASPSDDWYWHLSFASLDGSTSSTVYLDVQIVYDVEFFDRVLADVDLLSRVLQLSRSRAAYLAKRGSKKEEKKDPFLVEKEAALSDRPRAIVKDTAASLPAETEYEFVELRKLLRPVATRQSGAGIQ